MISWPLIVAGSTFSIGLLQLVNGLSDAWIGPVADKVALGHEGGPRFRHNSLLKGAIACGLCLLITYVLVTQVEGIHIFLQQQTNARANMIGITDQELRLHESMIKKRQKLHTK